MAHGGKRPNSGRRATPLARGLTPLRRTQAEEILAEIDEQTFWQDLLTAQTVTSVQVLGGEDGARENITVPDYRIRLDAGKYLTDRRDGKPAQSLQHTGPDGNAPVVRVLVEHIGTKDSPATKAGTA